MVPRLRSLSLYMAAFLLAAASLIPILALLSNSLADPSAEAFLFPLPSTLAHFKEVWAAENLPAYLFRSLWVGAGCSLLSLAVGAPAAWALARASLPYKGGIVASFYVLLSVPVLVYGLPLYGIFQKLGLLDSLSGLALAHAIPSLPIVVMVLRGVFETIPKELEDAALTLGLGRAGAFLKVTLPLSGPGLAASGLLAFLNSWNNFPLTLLLGGPNSNTMVMAATKYVRGPDAELYWGCAAAVLMLIPALILTYLAQKKIQGGALAGGMARNF